MHGSQNKSCLRGSLDGVSVLVTRPFDYARYLADEIEIRGGHPILLPTMQVDYIVEDSGFRQLLESDLDRQIVVFTSRNAVDAVAEWMARQHAHWPANLECAAVGPKTAIAIRSAFRLTDVLHPNERFGIDGLMELDRMQDLSRIPSAVIDGGGANSAKLVGLLQQRGSPSVAHCVVYRRSFPDIDTRYVSEYISRNTLDYVIITSVTGASNLFELLGSQSTDKLRVSCMIAYSERIAEFLRSKGFERIAVAGESSDDAVLEVIEKYVQNDTQIR